MHPDPEHEDKQNYFLDKAIFIDGITVFKNPDFRKRLPEFESKLCHY